MRGLLIFVLVGLLTGCRGVDPASDAPTAKSGADKPAASVVKAPGVLVGSVHLHPGAELPLYTLEEMERRVLTQTERGTYPDSCTPPKITDRQPVRLTPDGKLIGVMVTVSQFSQNPEHAPRTHEVVIKDCRLTPSIVVATAGDMLRIRNEVSFPFMPVYGDDPMLRTLMPGQLQEVPLKETGINSILCGFTSPCGRTDVVVLHHSLSAVTGEDGMFRIEGFPIDETVTVNAWHPLFESLKDEMVHLGQGETKTVDLELSVKARPKAEEPAVAAPADKPGKAKKPSQPK